MPGIMDAPFAAGNQPFRFIFSVVGRNVRRTWATLTAIFTIINAYEGAILLIASSLIVVALYDYGYSTKYVFTEKIKWKDLLTNIVHYYIIYSSERRAILRKYISFEEVVF